MSELPRIKLLCAAGRKTKKNDTHFFRDGVTANHIQNRSRYRLPIWDIPWRVYDTLDPLTLVGVTMLTPKIIGVSVEKE